MSVIRNCKINFVDMLCVYLFMYTALFMVDNSTLNQQFLWIAVPLMFVYAFYKRTLEGISLDIYEKRLLSLFLWMTFTIIVSIDYSASFTELKICWGAFVMIFVIRYLMSRKNTIGFMYFVYVLYLLDLLIYAQNHFVDVDITSQRAGDETVNANLYGYVLFFFNTSVFFLGELNRGILKRFFRVLYFSVVPISIYLGLLTASRQIMMINIPFFVMLCCIRYRLLNSKNLLVAVVICLSLLFLYGDYLLDLYNNSLLKARAEGAIEEDNRFFLLKNAIVVGINHPIFGVGPNCFAVINHGMSHNSYAEIFANAGIPGLLMYTCLLGVFIRRQFIRYRQTKDSIILVFFVFGIIYAFYNFFYVFYRSPWLIMFFVIVATHSELYYKKCMHLSKLNI